MRETVTIADSRQCTKLDLKIGGFIYCIKEDKKIKSMISFLFEQLLVLFLFYLECRLSFLEFRIYQPCRLFVFQLCCKPIFNPFYISAQKCVGSFFTQFARTSRKVKSYSTRGEVINSKVQSLSFKSVGLLGNRAVIG